VNGVEGVEQLEHELEEMKQQRKAMPHHLKWEELPMEDKCERLAPNRKRLMDTVKPIAYRAETALMKIVREAVARDDARSLIRICSGPRRIYPPTPRRASCASQSIRWPNPYSNRALEHLLSELSAASVHYPGTTLKLVYRLVGGRTG